MIDCIQAGNKIRVWLKVILGYICLSLPLAYVDHCFRNGRWSTYRQVSLYLHRFFLFTYSYFATWFSLTHGLIIIIFVKVQITFSLT